ncbi:hypothetical protein KIN20_014588 [Parelaphostrongylus tenuis]|uniref:Uncharacterized protein n=1 Tax=Parelaphostrongylus tenuis TaxID=148309 RepID=A0AAD5MIJ8_PARTN|nr:hypothetical protein KIN20_014588 [Parelaphostrongylus tenuis]
MILDPIINTIADQKIMAMLNNWLRYFRTSMKSARRIFTVTRTKDMGVFKGN